MGQPDLRMENVFRHSKGSLLSRHCAQDLPPSDALERQIWRGRAPFPPPPPPPPPSGTRVVCPGGPHPQGGWSLGQCSLGAPSLEAKSISARRSLCCVSAGPGPAVVKRKNAVLLLKPLRRKCKCSCCRPKSNSLAGPAMYVLWGCLSPLVSPPGCGIAHAVSSAMPFV